MDGILMMVIPAINLNQHLDNVLANQAWFLQGIPCELTYSYANSSIHRWFPVLRKPSVFHVVFLLYFRVSQGLVNVPFWSSPSSICWGWTIPNSWVMLTLIRTFYQPLLPTIVTIVTNHCYQPLLPTIVTNHVTNRTFYQPLLPTCK